jgi:hypothetical protein
MIKEYKYGFRVKPGRDDLIISWIEGIQASDKSYHIREALRDYLNKRIPQDPSPAGTLNSSNAISEAKNKVDTNTREEVDVEVSASKLEANFNSWID